MTTDVEDTRTETQRVAALGTALAEELTKATGTPWTMTKYPGKARGDEGDTWSYGEVARADGAAFTLHGAGWAGRGRISVHGDFPRRDGSAETFGPRYGTAEADACRATVSAERAQGDTLAACARSIVRRIAEPYLAAFAAALEAKKRSDDYDAAARSLADRVRDVLGDERDYTNGNSARGDRAFYVNHGQTYASGYATDDSVSFDHLSVPAGKALRIAAILIEPDEPRA